MKTFKELYEAANKPIIYFPSYSAAVQYAKKNAEEKGFEVPDGEWFQNVNNGDGKPGAGKTTKHNLALTKNGKPTKKGLSIQVYNRDVSGNTYELNFYIN